MVPQESSYNIRATKNEEKQTHYLIPKLAKHVIPKLATHVATATEETR